MEREREDDRRKLSVYLSELGAKIMSETGKLRNSSIHLLLTKPEEMLGKPAGTAAGRCLPRLKDGQETVGYCWFPREVFQ